MSKAYDPSDAWNAVFTSCELMRNHPSEALQNYFTALQLVAGNELKALEESEKVKTQEPPRKPVSSKEEFLLAAVTFGKETEDFMRKTNNRVIITVTSEDETKPILYETSIEMREPDWS